MAAVTIHSDFGAHIWYIYIYHNSFELWCWRRLLRVPWTARTSNQSILKEISPGCSLEGLMLKLKLQYFGNLMQSWLVGKDSDAGRDWGQEEKGTTEDEMAGWHHRLNGREFGWTPGVGDGQEGLACCNSWSHKESDTTERLNWTELIPLFNMLPVSSVSKSQWTTPQTRNHCFFYLKKKKNLFICICLHWVFSGFL